MTNPNIVTSEDLMEAMNASSPGYVENKLREQGIKYFYGVRGAIWTTLDLINAAGGLTPLNDDKHNEEDIL